MIWVILGATFFVVLMALIFLIPGVVGAPYVPSKREQVKQAFSELYKVSKKDFLIDLGSGDGVVLEMAREKGARVLGVELNPVMVLYARVRRRVRVTLYLVSNAFDVPEGALVKRVGAHYLYKIEPEG